jgi:hypothetical protein
MTPSLTVPLPVGGHTPCDALSSLRFKCITGDLSVAVMTGNAGYVQGVLDSEECSQEQLDEALELAAMLNRVQILRLLLQHGADPTARGAAALAWAEQRQGEPQVLTALHECRKIAPGRLVVVPLNSSSSSSSSSSAGHLSVAAWCRGLQQELSELRSPSTPEPRLQSLQQFMSGANSPGQRTVRNLLAYLQQEWPELFPAWQSSCYSFGLEGAGAAAGPTRGTSTGGILGQEQKSDGVRAATPGAGSSSLLDQARKL